MNAPKILIIGTGDTKSDELNFMRDCIIAAGANAVMMDVSVLKDPKFKPDYSKHDVATAAGTTIEAIVQLGDENAAMAKMGEGAAKLASTLCAQDKMHGTIILGGTLGTDLALDVCNALPLGLPKFVVSTVAFSQLIPASRIPTDLMMILWAGGLFGLNSICKSSLSQACGAVVGAARARIAPTTSKPIIGMTSLSILRYMWLIKPELEKRGYELAVFHSTGMGGRAFESIASQKGFAAVMDFCLQEVVNHENGELACSAGPDRLENAGKHGVPQIVAPGAIDMVDMPSWLPVPERFAGRPYHAHNRLVGSIITSPEARKKSAHTIAEKLNKSKGPVAFILPVGGIEEWDKPDEPLHDPEGLAAFMGAMRHAIKPPVKFHEIPDHINSQEFANKALEIFDDWVAKGIIPKGQP
jgi:uncharacterized protein (UPF0261 family)